MMYQRRKYIIYSLLVVVLMSTSCNKWLDVNPSRQIKESNLFDNQQGFVDALFAAYQNAADPKGYGDNLTFGFLDVLAQRYENKNNQLSDIYGQAARYNYMDVEVNKTTEAIWRNSYKTISQANYILKNVDEKKSVLTDQAYNIIKGESLAIRGFMHFDLLRLYAPAYADGANAAEKAIPYAQAFSVIPQQKITVQEVLDKIELDLKAAEQLLSVYPVIDQIAGNQGSTSLELFLQYRQNHLNYWAVKGILARLYLYKGDKVNALKYAKEVIDSQKFPFISQTTLNVDPTTTASDLTFTSEHIFSIYVTGLKKLADDKFKSTLAAAGDLTDLFSTRAKLDAIYEVSQIGYGTDIRNPAAAKSLWNQLSANVVYTKKYYSDNDANVKQRLIPVLKIAEMYYIAAEASPITTDGVGYLNKVRAARLLPDLALNISSSLLQDELQKEYRKEFYAEGQLWFYYKRKNTVTIPDGVGNPLTKAKYVFPLPNAEIEFGN